MSEDSLSGHDPLTTHLVEGVLTFKSSRVGAVLGGTDSDTELVSGHVAIISSIQITPVPC